MPDHLPLATVPPYVEVSSPDGKVWRFAAGTKAGFAVSRIRSKLPELSSENLCIEAVKEGEEPVDFGPDAELVRYGENWKLRISEDLAKVGSGPNQENVAADSKVEPELQGQLRDIKDIVAEFYPAGKLPKGSKQEFSWDYIQRVVLCCGLMVLFAALLQYVLKSLPKF
ncbi:hypothetical protein O6H91_Y118400 [Diphasiastrum complanatum]|nr:hypothetical protein O6H91_Y118400 [Diphasiastrum complanatum]